ncbi:hypothetical protein [Embleya sp. NPDC005971]|uniref:hypothetical protein n=1 Tax=unclassified Embleya TaxID=2699296 RepID=UPI0033DD3083
MMPQYVQVGQMNYAQPPAHTQPQAAIPAQHEHGGAQSPPHSPPPSTGGGAGGGRGAVIGAAVAIVLVIAVVAGVLLTRGDGDKKEKASPTTASGGPSSPPQSQSAPPSSAPSTAPGGKFAVLEAEDASPSGGAVAVPGVPNSSGKGMLDMSAPGSTITWKVEVPKKGTYYLAVKFLNAGTEQQNLSIRVNGKDTSNKVRLKNYGTATSVTGTWNMVQLNEGSNDVALTCGTGDSCKAALDQVWFENQQPNLK